MALTNAYSSLELLKEKLDKKVENTDHDGELELILNAVSRWIDRDRNRRIYAATETRTYTPEYSDLLTIDDLVTLTSIKTDEDGDGTYENTWASTDYYLSPYNAPSDNIPYQQIEKSRDGDYNFPKQRKSTEVIGSFGWATTIPDGIAAACLLASTRLYLRRELIFGIVGNADMGTLMAAVAMVRDGELQALLSTVPKRVT